MTKFSELTFGELTFGEVAFSDLTFGEQIEHRYDSTGHLPMTGRMTLQLL